MIPRRNINNGSALHVPVSQHPSLLRLQITLNNRQIRVQIQHSILLSPLVRLQYRLRHIIITYLHTSSHRYKGNRHTLNASSVLLKALRYLLKANSFWYCSGSASSISFIRDFSSLRSLSLTCLALSAISSGSRSTAPFYAIHMESNLHNLQSTCN